MPYLTSGQGWRETTSLRRTRRLVRTTRGMRIFSSVTVSSDSTMQTVSKRTKLIHTGSPRIYTLFSRKFVLLPFRFFPLIITVSPRKSCNSSILVCDRDTTELSSPTESSTISRFGFGLSFKMAVERSSALQHKNQIRKSLTELRTYFDMTFRYFSQ